MDKSKLYTQCFLFQKNGILFSLRLSDILSCISFLEKIGFLPPLPEDYFEKEEKYEQEDNWRMALLLYDNGTDVLDTKTWNVPEEMPDPGKVLAELKENVYQTEPSVHDDYFFFEIDINGKTEYFGAKIAIICFILAELDGLIPITSIDWLLRVQTIYPEIGELVEYLSCGKDEFYESFQIAYRN